MTTVENAHVVNHVTIPSSSVKVEDADSDLIEAALNREEDMIDDEEINSCDCEGQGDEMTEKIENQMLTVALVNSVVDTTGPNSEKVPNQSSRRSSTRKRRRPSNYGTADPEHPVKQGACMIPRSIEGSTHNGSSQVAAVHAKPAMKEPLRPKPTGKPPEATASIPSFERSVDMPDPLAVKVETVGNSVKARQRSTQKLGVQPAQIATQVKNPLSSTKNKRKSFVSVAKSADAQRVLQIAVKEEPLLPTSGIVPNPLSLPLQSSAAVVQNTADPSTSNSSSDQRTSVPWPLPTSVPCPLPPTSFDDNIESIPSEKKVTITEPHFPTTRGRIFSVDLDPSTFDFPDIGGSENDKSDNADVAYPDVAPSSDLSIFQRDRAFSFEFFNFAGDDLLPSTLTTGTTGPEAGNTLPEAPVEPVVASRPRGDSIIFDPSSFQEGGIHEKNALLKGRAPSMDSAAEGLIHSTRFTNAPAPVPPPEIRAPAPPPPPPPAHTTVTTVTTPNPLPTYDVVAAPTTTVPSGQTATLPSALSTNSSNVTFQMDLLNKDGRIGIYLPDARKARIARFHAKRKMRIWRKRIKYDCRKKLADSRPRIKGRFVKRSDMEED